MMPTKSGYMYMCMQTIVCFSSVGRGFQLEVDVIVVCIHLVEGMPIQMYGETQFVDFQVRTIYGWIRNEIIFIA